MTLNLPAPTVRLFVLVMAVAAPLVLGTFSAVLVGVAGALFLGLAASLFADYLSAAPTRALQVERQHAPRLYLAYDNPVRLRVTNSAPQTVTIRLRDTPPVAFVSSTLFVEGTVVGKSELTLEYTTRPTARGRYRFGGVVLRWRTPLGLLWREVHLALDEEVPVYPNLREIDTYDLLTKRGLLRELGVRNTRALGRGTAFESLREYQRDDDFRWIDWKATARRRQPITTLYETERNQRLMIVLDLGRMMQTRVGELTRLDHAVNASLLLGYVALSRGDRVGLLSFADQIDAYATPRSGKAHFYHIVDQLYAVRAQTVESDYTAAFNRLRHDLHGRSLIAFFTDLSDPDVARTIARHLAALSRHHLPICIALSDPVLVEKSRQTPTNSRELYERVVASLRLEERDTILDELRHLGVATVDVPADHLAIETINRYLEIKERALL